MLVLQTGISLLQLLCLLQQDTLLLFLSLKERLHISHVLLLHLQGLQLPLQTVVFHLQELALLGSLLLTMQMLHFLHPLLHLQFVAIANVVYFVDFFLKFFVLSAC